MLETCRKPFDNQSETRWKPFGGNQSKTQSKTNRKPVLLPRTNYFPVLLCTTKLAQTTSQYYIALQRRYSTTVCYKSCTNTFPVLPYTTSRFNTTVYYKARTKSLPILPYTAKLAQSRSSTTVYYKTRTKSLQYYSILQNLHKHVPVLPYITKFMKAPLNQSETSLKPL